MDLYHVEALFWESTGKADRYKSQTSDILASDRFILSDVQERDGTNTFILKTQGAGKYWAVTFLKNGLHTARTITEQEAVNMWAEMEASSNRAVALGGTASPDMESWSTAFPGIAITDV